MLVELVNLALSQTHRTGICVILGELAKATNSYGAILWELDPDIPVSDPAARLFTAGHWFRSGKRLAAHDLSVSHSLIGQAIQNKRLETADDVWEHPQTAKSDLAQQFYKEHDIARCQVVPVHFSDNKPGAVILYRTSDSPPFPATGEPLLLQFCRLLPGLHESLHHKVSVGLIDQVKDILQEPCKSEEDLKVICLLICEAIQQCFHLIEASLFLEDRIRKVGDFRLIATTCSKYVAHEIYKANEGGLTSWAITNRSTLIIWDLRYYHGRAEKSLIEKLYPGVVWLNPVGAEKTTAELLDVPKNQIPPLSFIAEPLLSAGDVCGVLRCCTAKDAPYYFTHRERALLGVVASQLAEYWIKWLDRRTVDEENFAWSKLVESITTLNYSVNSELRRQTPEVLNVFRKGLDATANMIPGGEITDIRLWDESSDELYFAVTRGSAWTEESKQIRFSASQKPPQSAGSHVYQTGQMTVIPDVQRHPYYRQIFTNAHSMLIAPIRSLSKIYGVIDIRSTSSKQFPSYAEQMAELLGQQLGLYHELIDTVSSLRITQQQLKEHTRITEHAFADWQHQIRGPLNQAYLRLGDTIRSEFRDYDAAPQYIKIQRGLLRKAKRASQSLRLHLELTRGQSPRLNLQRISCDVLQKLLLETCLDNRVLASPFVVICRIVTRFEVSPFRQPYRVIRKVNTVNLIYASEGVKKLLPEQPVLHHPVHKSLAFIMLGAGQIWIGSKQKESNSEFLIKGLHLVFGLISSPQEHS